MKTGWDLAAQARTDFADMVEGLSADQLAAPSLCENWSTQDVAGHLVSFIKLSLPSMMLGMAKAGFNADKAWRHNATKYGAAPIAAIAADLREHAAKPSAMKSFPPELTVADAAVHTQDVRRPLGLDGALDPDVLRTALDFCTGHAKGKMLVPTKDIAGLRLEATDIDWSWGEGATVSGPAEALLLAINRRDTRGELTGDGVAQLPR